MSLLLLTVTLPGGGGGDLISIAYCLFFHFCWQIQLLQQEKERLARELDEVHRLHKDELEIQQLQHYQTFRNYREMFEEQKVAIEQRYRSLLEDAIQDAVFLSSRNSELVDENQQLRQRKLNDICNEVLELRSL